MDGSRGFDKAMDDDVEEESDAVMQDEYSEGLWRALLGRSDILIASHMLGSSFDPDMEDDDEVAACTEHLVALTELEDISEDESFSWERF